MTLRDRFKQWLASERFRYALFLIGCLLIILAPVVGIFPGPGGIIFFGVGAGLVLKNSLWAKKRYVAFKKRHPRYGSWADWSLRRQSAKRREAIAKQNRVGGD
ncbi:hypothetical protein [Sphingobium boeckii]|uniref:Transmembrane protein (PGPGW) n=1 Tax=Sphingobium boeckii TaxID=1082345 RepID=A0A7W9EEY8_9SPHN|nr:hypothetical protein [Sphingobium boeckii]MBB5685161.1 hypothetical protein [Sphingobium boeckii]